MNKKRIIAALIPSLIVLGLVAYLWSVNLVFLLASELSIETEMENRTYWAVNGESINLELTTRVDAPNTCSTTCEFILREVPTNKTLFENSGEVNSLHVDEISYLVDQSTDDTIHLSYTAKCANVASAICSTAQDPYYETTFITIHHEQTQQQQQNQASIQSRLENIFLTLSTAQHFINQTQVNIQSLNFSTDETLSIALSVQQTTNTLELHTQKYEELSTLYQENNYAQINLAELMQLLDDAQSIEAESFQLQEQSTQLFTTIQDSFTILNDLIPTQNILFYIQTSPATVSLQGFAQDSSRQLYSTISRASLKSIFSVDTFSQSVTNLQDDIQTLETFYERTESELIQQTSNLTNTTPTNLQTACLDIQSTVSFMEIFNDDINNSNFTTNQTMLIQEESLLFYQNRSTNLTYPNLTPFHANWLEALENLEDLYCIDEQNNATLIPVVIPQDTKLDFTFTPMALVAQDAENCVYGICTSIQEEQPYPLILVHGHALTSITSPEAALHSFSKIQEQLEAQGYVNVGELNDYPIKSWKEVEGPISVRASYYFISYAEFGQYQFYSRKYESIESYAIRLKEIVDEVKVKTGSDKVVILAHSMGGLVTRQYLSLFGEEDVQKAILVGTPNNGVIGASKNLCSLTGADRECEEMAQDSVFLRRLNQFIPTQTKIYTIAGIGCPKDGFDGDGVVNLNSVLLDYANNTIVEGVCTDTLNSDMHKALIDPDEYPQVYDRVVEILGE